MLRSLAVPLAAARLAVPAALPPAPARGPALALPASSLGAAVAPALPAAAADGPDAPAPEEPKPALPSPEQFAQTAQALFREAQAAEAARLAAPKPEAEPPADGEMRDRLEKLPSVNPEREAFMVQLFKIAGAQDGDIAFQDAGRGRRNIVVTKKGKTDRLIIVGAHHDKVTAGLGKIDNGTGATMVANLYQALHDVETDATLVFVAFAREEEGLIGSSAFVSKLSAEGKLGKVDAMLNLDTLAVDGTFSWKNNSTRALLDRLTQVAKENGRALAEAHLDGGDADSSSFREAGVPAVTVYGASQDVIFDIIHSRRDNMSAFSLEHYKNAYLLSLDAVRSLDRRALGPVERETI